MASEAHLRAQYELVIKENKQLKQHVDQLKRENQDLKRSVYELTYKLDTVQNAIGHHTAPDPFPVSYLLSNESDGKKSDDEELIPSNDLNISSSFSHLHSSILDDHHLITSSVDDMLYTNASMDSRVLVQKSELRAHSGAVYTAKFSPCGQLLASGSMDCKVILWDVTRKFNQQQQAVLAQHQQLVIDVSWSNDSTSLVSASYDHTAKLWDVEKQQLLKSSEVQGLVQCVAFSMTDSNLYYLGTSKCALQLVDYRSDVMRKWTNNAMINSLHVSHDGQYVITGDSKGWIKTWDIRMDECIKELSRLNDPGGHAISHIHASSDEEGRFLGVNSYDNVLRVYDRRSKLISSGPNGVEDPMQLAFAVTGHKNANWPIKSTFFRGAGYKYKLHIPKRHTSMSYAANDLSDLDDHNILTLDRHHTSDLHHHHRHAAVGGSMIHDYDHILLATGSADNKIYLHDLSQNYQNQLIQKIESHSDRVYSVDFHPTEPILASASADFSVKIWVPRSTNRSTTKPSPQ